MFACSGEREWVREKHKKEFSQHWQNQLVILRPVCFASLPQTKSSKCCWFFINLSRFELSFEVRTSAQRKKFNLLFIFIESFVKVMIRFWTSGQWIYLKAFLPSFIVVSHICEQKRERAWGWINKLSPTCKEVRCVSTFVKAWVLSVYWVVQALANPDLTCLV